MVSATSVIRPYKPRVAYFVGTSAFHELGDEAKAWQKMIQHGTAGVTYPRGEAGSRMNLVYAPQVGVSSFGSTGCEQAAGVAHFQVYLETEEGSERPLITRMHGKPGRALSLCGVASFWCAGRFTKRAGAYVERDADGGSMHHGRVADC